MKKLFFIILLMAGIHGFSQSSFEINFERDVIPSLLNNETDSLFGDRAIIKIFETGDASSIDIKYYDYSDSGFSEIHSSAISVGSITDTPCNTAYCSYKLNPNVVIIQLGSKSATGPKNKVYIKINGSAGKGDLVKEVEL